MTLAHFNLHMERLRVLRFQPDTLTEHWKVVRLACEDETFTKAIGRTLCTRSDFPTPAELLTDLKLEQERPVASALDDSRETDLETPHIIELHSETAGVSIRLPITREWKYYCEDCSDTGWQDWWCGSIEQKPLGMELRLCGRNRQHAPHTWGQPCVCIATNPALARRQVRRVLGRNAQV